MMGESSCTIPEPLTPPDCDLRGYDFMPLHGNKLFGSRLYGKALRNPRAGLAAMKLWWAAWQQCPAGSLPNDDDDLAFLADFGTDTKGWMKCKTIALHGFVLCSDGRFYHPLLCAEATHAYERRVSERERKAQQRAAKKEKRAKNTSGSDDEKDENKQDVPDLSRGTPQGQGERQDADVRSNRTGQDSISSLRSDIPPVTPPTPDKPDPRGTRLPEDWEPTDEMRSYALSLNLNPTDVGENFRDYWVSAAGAKARKADWTATWRGWCRREAERKRGAIAPVKTIPQTRQDRVHDAWAGVPTIPGV